MPLTRILDPPISETDRTRKIKDWDWRKIQGAAAPIPDEWINPLVVPYLKPTRIDQGGRGTCTGYSLSMAQFILQILRLLNKIPTPADIANVKRGLSKDVGCKYPMIYDQLIPQFPSPGFAYLVGRWKAFGNPLPPDAPPAGGFVRECVQAWCEYGMCLEQMFVTSKDPKCCPDFYNEIGETQAEVLDEAAKHTAEGYAQVIEFDEICEAIYRDWESGGLGGILIPTNLYDDCGEMLAVSIAGHTVHIYSNGGAGRGEVAGSHAQFVCGYSKSQGYLVVASSWGTSDQEWPFLNGWSRAHHERAAGPGFTILDKHEVDIGLSIYCTTIIDANVPCRFTVEDSRSPQTHTEQPVKVSLAVGQQYRIIAYPTDPASVLEQSREVILTPDKSLEVPGPDGKPVIYLTFQFTKKEPEPQPGPFDWLVELIRWLLGAIFRRGS